MANDRNSSTGWKNTIKDVLSINKKVDNIEDIAFKRYTANIKKRFKALTESQLKMLEDVYDEMDTEEKKRAKKDFNAKVDAYKKSLDYWSKYQSKISKDMSFIDKVASKVFYANRKADLVKLNNVSKNVFKDITDEGTKMTKSLSTRIGDVAEKLRDWQTAFNVDAIKEGAEEVARSSRDLRNEVMRYAKFSSSDWADLNKQASEFSKNSGYAIDKLKYLETAKDIVVNLKLNDKGTIEKYSEILTKLKDASGGDIGSAATLVEISQQSGMGGSDYVNRTGSKMLALQQMEGSATTVEDLMNEYNDNIRKLKTLANGDASMISKYTDQLLAMSTAGNSSYTDGLNKELMNIMSMSMEEIADYMQSHPGINAQEIQKMMKQGNFEDAAKKWIGDFNNIRSKMISQNGVAGWNQFKQSTGFDLGDINEDQITSQDNINAYFSAYDSAMEKINEQAKAGLTDLDNYQPPEATWIERTKNWFKSSKFGSFLSDTLNELDLDMMDIYFATGVLSKVGGGLKGALGKLAGTKVGALAIDGAKSAGKGLLSKAGSTALSMTGGLAGGLIQNFGGNAKASVVGSKAGGLLGKIGTAGAFFSGGLDLFSGISGKISGEDSTESTKNLAQGAVKVGATAIGMLLGGPLGAMIGSAVGEFIAGFINDDTAKWLNDLTDKVADSLASSWDAFTGACKTALDKVKSVFSTLGYLYIGIWDMALDKIFDIFGGNWQDTKTNMINGVKEFGTMFIEQWSQVTSWADNQITYISNGLSNMWSKFSDWASDAWNSVGNTANNVWKAITSYITGSDAYKTVTGLIDKVSKLATGTGSALMDFLQKAVGRGKDTVAQVDGSHKTGLDSVPFDGYIAELHKNESVLTASQAEQWRAIQASANGQNVSDFMHKAYNATKIDRAALLASYQAAQSSSGGARGAMANAASNSMADIMKAFIGMGYSKAAAAGIVGNLYHESAHTLSPSVIQGNGAGPAAGIAQWENYTSKSDRWADLDRFAKSNNSQWDNLNTQLSFIDAELRGAQGTEGTTSRLLDSLGGYQAFKQLSDVRTATDIFEEAFERAGTPAMSERYQFANQALASYDVGTPWVPNDQIALLHKGEAVVPADHNPYNDNNNNVSPADSEVVKVLKVGFARVEKAIRETNSNFSLSNMPLRPATTATDDVFRF